MKIKKTAQLQQVSIDTLKPHPDNPRVHSSVQVNQIATSIEEFGFKFPVLIDSNSQIIAGHGRVMAARHVGLDYVPVITADIYQRLK